MSCNINFLKTPLVFEELDRELERLEGIVSSIYINYNPGKGGPIEKATPQEVREVLEDQFKPSENEYFWAEYLGGKDGKNRFALKKGVSERQYFREGTGFRFVEKKRPALKKAYIEYKL